MHYNKIFTGAYKQICFNYLVAMGTTLQTTASLLANTVTKNHYTIVYNNLFFVFKHYLYIFNKIHLHFHI